MTLLFVVYLINQVEGITRFLVLTGSLLAIATLIVVGMLCIIYNDYGNSPDDDAKKLHTARLKLCKRLMIFSVFVIALSAFLPSEKTAYLMAGAYVTQQVVTSDFAVDTSKKVATIIDQKLNTYIDHGEKVVNAKIDEVSKKVVDKVVEKVVE